MRASDRLHHAARVFMSVLHRGVSLPRAGRRASTTPR
jgi:hypothetical protein